MAQASGVIIDGGNQGFNCLQVDSSRQHHQGSSDSELPHGNCPGIDSGEQHHRWSRGRDRNIIGPNDAVGIEIDGVGNLVQGNHIGTDVSGTESRPNAMEGIWIAPGAENNVVGGSGPGEGNLIAGTTCSG